MTLETVWEYRDLILLLISIILAIIARHFQSKAGLYESYKKANVAVRGFVGAVLESLEDMVVTANELDEMKQKSEVMVAAIREFLDKLDDGELSDEEVEHSIQVIQELGRGTPR